MLSGGKRIMVGDQYYDIRCLSTDTKPINLIKNGSTLVEIDTSDTYMFDEEHKQWIKVPIDVVL